MDSKPTTKPNPGSPIRQPASQLGRLLTVLYGTLGIPLLLVTVAKSGQHLARSSLNGLLYIRHYCLTLPLHYLCCSCNLLVCLRLLSWCCCCCCCSYLFCLNDKKRTKCCDFGNAPALKLHRKRRRPAPRRRPGRRGPRNVTKPERRQPDEDQQQQPLDEATSGGGTYVIGFNLQQMQSQDERQKSVRFNERRDSGSQDGTSSSEEGDEDSSNEDQDEHDQDEAWRLLASSLTILLCYVMLGSIYHAHQHELPLVDALFACFSMLSTSKLPDSFQLDGANPIVLYKSRAKLQTSIKISAESSSKLVASDDLALVLDSLYLLVGLNMIAACAQFGRLWFDGTVRRKFAACPRKPKNSHQDLNKPNSGSLIGSLERHQSSQFANNQSDFSPPSAAPSVLQSDQQVGYQLSQFAVLSSANEATSSPPCSTDQMRHQEANDSTARQGANQLNLSELYVLNPADQLGCNQIHYSDGASFASSSSQTAVAAPLCAHHQKAVAQGTLERPHQHRHHFHTHQHQHQPNGLSDCSSSANTNSQPITGALHHSSSLMQLFDAPQMGFNQTKNSSTATLTRRNQLAPLYKNGVQPNGLNGGQQEPDSSPNTFDITNSQTNSSSASSRAAPTVMKPSRFVVGHQLPVTLAIRPANEKAVSWFEVDDNNDRVKQY